MSKASSCNECGVIFTSCPYCNHTFHTYIDSLFCAKCEEEIEINNGKGVLQIVHEYYTVVICNEEIKFERLVHVSKDQESFGEIHMLDEKKGLYCSICKEVFRL